jgi:hypothetical protein
MTRFRSRVSQTITGPRVTVINGVTQSGYQQANTLFSESESFTDVVTPDFRKKMALGAIIMNPCSHVKTTVKNSGGGYFKFSRNTDPLSTYREFSGGGSLSSFWRSINTAESSTLITFDAVSTTTAIAVAQQKAIANIDSAPLELAEDAFSIRETARFLKSPMSSLDRLSKSFKKDVTKRLNSDGNYRKGKRTKDRAAAIADVWTEYRFAFRPLVLTTDSLLGSLAGHKARPTFQASHGTVEPIELKISDTEIRGATSSKYYWNRRGSKKVEVRATVLYTIANPLQDWRYLYGLRNKDLARTAYDLLPYSFMVDRVLDIGSSISGLANLLDPSISIVSGCVSVKSTERKEYNLFHCVIPNWTVVLVGDTDSTTTESYDRSLWQPTLSNILPSLTPGNVVRDLSSIADLAALVYQNLR